MNIDINSLPDVLYALQGPWIALAASLVITLCEEYIPAFWIFPAFKDRSSKSKRLYTCALCMVIPLLACLVSTLLGYQVNDIRYGWYPAVLAGIFAFGSATLIHTRKLSGAPA